MTGGPCRSGSGDQGQGLVVSRGGTDPQVFGPRHDRDGPRTLGVAQLRRTREVGGFSPFYRPSWGRRLVLHLPLPREVPQAVGTGRRRSEPLPPGPIHGHTGHPCDSVSHRFNPKTQDPMGRGGGRREFPGKKVGGGWKGRTPLYRLNSLLRPRPVRRRSGCPTPGPN